MDELKQRIIALLEKIRSKVEQMQHTINRLLSHVPKLLSWVVSKVHDLWNKFLVELGRFWDWFSDKLAYAGDPGLLHDTGERWNTELGMPTHRRAGEVDSDDLLVDDNWTGDAADAYKSHIGEQKSALEAVGGLATTVSSALNTMKTGIWMFWIGIIAAVVVLVTGIIAATAATGTLIGIPAGIAAAIFAVLGFLAAAGTGVAALTFQCSDAADTLRSARGYAETWPTFALG